jgi:hypothetical protein
VPGSRGATDPVVDDRRARRVGVGSQREEHHREERRDEGEPRCGALNR